MSSSQVSQQTQVKPALPSQDQTKCCLSTCQKAALATAFAVLALAFCGRQWNFIPSPGSEVLIVVSGAFVGLAVICAFRNKNINKPEVKPADPGIDQSPSLALDTTTPAPIPPEVKPADPVIDRPPVLALDVTTPARNSRPGSYSIFLKQNGRALNFLSLSMHLPHSPATTDEVISTLTTNPITLNPHSTRTSQAALSSRLFKGILGRGLPTQATPTTVENQPGSMSETES